MVWITRLARWNIRVWNKTISCGSVFQSTLFSRYGWVVYHSYCFLKCLCCGKANWSQQLLTNVKPKNIEENLCSSEYETLTAYFIIFCNVLFFVVCFMMKLDAKNTVYCPQLLLLDMFICCSNIYANWSRHCWPMSSQEIFEEYLFYSTHLSYFLQDMKPEPYIFCNVQNLSEKCRQIHKYFHNHVTYTPWSWSFVLISNLIARLQRSPSYLWPHLPAVTSQTANFANC